MGGELEAGWSGIFIYCPQYYLAIWFWTIKYILWALIPSSIKWEEFQVLFVRIKWDECGSNRKLYNNGKPSWQIIMTHYLANQSISHIQTLAIVSACSSSPDKPSWGGGPCQAGWSWLFFVSCCWIFLSQWGVSFPKILALYFLFPDVS